MAREAAAPRPVLESRRQVSGRQEEQCVSWSRPPIVTIQQIGAGQGRTGSLILACEAVPGYPARHEAVRLRFRTSGGADRPAAREAARFRAASGCEWTRREAGR